MNDKITTAYVLAGGLSLRMGKDKRLLKLGSETLLERTVRICRECFAITKIAAKAGDNFSGLETVTDYPGCQGPLAGIIAALRDCDEAACFITAVDFPDLCSGLIKKLTTRYSNQHYLGVEEQGGLQPLCGIYSKSALPHLVDAAGSGNHKVRDILKELDCQSISHGQDRWRNLNKPDDLISLGNDYV